MCCLLFHRMQDGKVCYEKKKQERLKCKYQMSQPPSLSSSFLRSFVQSFVAWPEFNQHRILTLVAVLFISFMRFSLLSLVFTVFHVSLVHWFCPFGTLVLSTEHSFTQLKSSIYVMFLFQHSFLSCPLHLIPFISRFCSFVLYCSCTLTLHILHNMLQIASAHVSLLYSIALGTQVSEKEKSFVASSSNLFQHSFFLTFTFRAPCSTSN